MSLVEFINVNKSFKNGDLETVICDGFNLSINEGELVAIMGKSGCGKTTILNMIAGIETIDSGEYYFDGKCVKIVRASDGVKFRRNRIGIILQHFALINDYTAYENIEIGLWESKLPNNTIRKLTNDMIDALNIGSLRKKYPYQLSGGEKQRVAIGRALICKPKLLLADEPTGALDSETESDIIYLLKNLNQEIGTTMIIVTHDVEVADNCERTIYLEKH